MPWESLDHDADLALRITGATLTDLFEEAARAVSAAVGDAPPAAESTSFPAVLEASDLADLLHAWLSEVLYRLETDRAYFLSASWRDLSADPPRLMAEARAAHLPPDWRGRLEVKGVTYHDLRIEGAPNGGYAATVVLDV